MNQRKNTDLLYSRNPIENIRSLFAFLESTRMASTRTPPATADIDPISIAAIGLRMVIFRLHLYGLNAKKEGRLSAEPPSAIDSTPIQPRLGFLRKNAMITAQVRLTATDNIAATTAPVG